MKILASRIAKELKKAKHCAVYEPELSRVWPHDGERREVCRVKYWEIIADNLSKAGWTWGCVATIDSSGRTIFVADAHRDDGKRFVVRSDEKLSAFLELERAICIHLLSQEIKS